MAKTKSAAHIQTVQNKFQVLKPVLNERSRRLWAASEAIALGNGGQTVVYLATGIDYKTIKAGVTEISQPDTAAPTTAIRRSGGGRKQLTTNDPTLEPDLEELLEPKGDPMRAVQWTTKSPDKLAGTLKQAGHKVSATTIARILKAKEFSLQANKKNIEGVSHPDRDDQFHLINATVKDFLATGDPIISVAAKKKELFGNFKNNGREWTPKGGVTSVNVYDFPSLADGKAVPYGVYDIVHNARYVNVGTDADTGAFSVESIRRWWHDYGKEHYPNNRRLLITCDGGGSNSSRGRLWKTQLPELATQIGLDITVRHYPPATSKWNKIEHRLFSYLSINWRGKPLTSLETVIELISFERLFVCDQVSIHSPRRTPTVRSWDEVPPCLFRLYIDAHHIQFSHATTT
jgi:Rhodopirellula transposase DDE domain